MPGLDLPDPILYEVRMQTGQREIIPGTLTDIWGYDGQYPGPTFRVQRNQPIVVRFINELDVEQSIHNHGGHTPFGSDGFPNDFIFPGEFKDYCYPNIAPDDDDAEFASTQWYHDHAMDITAENVYMGLAGFYLLFGDLEPDIFFIGVTLTPEIDTPAVLKAYAEQFGTKPGWTFVTGLKDDIEMLRRKMGVYDPDPVVDADLYSHAGLVTFGNEPTGRWSALPGTMRADQITKAILRRTRPIAQKRP